MTSFDPTRPLEDALGQPLQFGEKGGGPMSIGEACAHLLLTPAPGDDGADGLTAKLDRAALAKRLARAEGPLQITAAEHRVLNDICLARGSALVAGQLADQIGRPDAKPARSAPKAQAANRKTPQAPAKG